MTPKCKAERRAEEGAGPWGAELSQTVPSEVQIEMLLMTCEQNAGESGARNLKECRLEGWLATI